MFSAYLLWKSEYIFIQLHFFCLANVGNLVFCEPGKKKPDLEMLLTVLSICMLLFPTEPSPHFVLLLLMLQLTEAQQP